MTDRQGKRLGFQARKLHDDDPLKAKYVNTPESELFHKGWVLYGLDKARASIAREDRACVVEGNTDVIALRQAGFEPVVASMGTALTEQQLKELGRLTKRLWLAFDGDAAGETATLRGMELAAKQGFDVKVVALPPGIDPADDPAGFQKSLATAEPYLVYRVRIETEREEDREVRVPEHQGAARRCAGLARAAGRLAVRERQARHDRAAARQRRLGPGRGSGVAARARCSAKLERNALAGALAHERLKPLLAELTPDHFYDPVNRAIRAHIVDGAPLDADAVGLLAELDARAVAEGIDDATGEELLWRLRERQLRRELQSSDPSRTKELQEALQKLLERVAALSSA